MNGQKQNEEQKYLMLAIPIGAGCGVALGLVLMNILDKPGFFSLGIAIGMTVGVSIGLALDRRSRSQS